VFKEINTVYVYPNFIRDVQSTRLIITGKNYFKKPFALASQHKN